MEIGEANTPEDNREEECPWGDQWKEEKDEKVLRIGFLNVGGLTAEAHSTKDLDLRQSLSKQDFDIFGMSETNLAWHLLPTAARPHKCF